MDVKVTIEFVAKNVISEEELKQYYNNDLYDVMQDLIREEGLYGVVEADYNLTKVERL